MISTGAGIVALVIGSMADYALARFRYQIGRVANDQISNLFLSQRLFPVAVLAVPFLILYRELSLFDTQCSRTRKSAWRSPAISGADTDAQLEQNLGALDAELSPDDLRTLDEVSAGLSMVLDGAQYGPPVPQLR